MNQFFVYLIGERHGLYKIGYSSDPEQRIQQLPGGASGLSVRGLIPTESPTELERHMHTVFESRRFHGEWFCLSRSDVERWPSTEDEAFRMSPITDGAVTFPLFMPAWLSQSQRKGFHAPQELFDALDSYVETVRPRVTSSAALRTALEDYLTARGFWPPEGAGT